MQRVAASPINILRARNVAVAQGGAALLQARVACQGSARVKGGLHCLATASPATGYPRVVQYGDQSTVTGPSEISVLSGLVNADGTIYFDIDVDLHWPYVGIEYTQDGSGATTISEAQAELRGSD